MKALTFRNRSAPETLMFLADPNFFLSFLHLKDSKDIFQLNNSGTSMRRPVLSTSHRSGCNKILVPEAMYSPAHTPSSPSGDPPLSLSPSLSLLGLQVFDSSPSVGSYSPEKTAWAFPPSKGNLSSDLSSLKTVPGSRYVSYLTNLALARHTVVHLIQTI